MIRLKLEKDQLLPVLVQKYEVFLTDLLKNKADKLEELARVCDEPRYIWLTSANELVDKQQGYYSISINNNMSGGIKLFNGNVELIERKFKTIRQHTGATEHATVEESETPVDLTHLASRLSNSVLSNTPSYEGWSPLSLLTTVNKEIERIELFVKRENDEINKVLESFTLVNFSSEK